MKRRGASCLAAAMGLCLCLPQILTSATFEELAQQATAARRGNSIPEAIDLYRQAVEMRSSWVEGWWFLGTLSYATYHYADCESAFDQFVRLDDQRSLAWSLLGLCEFETGKYDTAQEHLQQGLTYQDLPPEVEAGVRFHYGLLLTKAGQFDQAKRQLARYSLGGAHEALLVLALGVNALHMPILPKDVPSEQLEAVSKAGEAARHWILGEDAAAESGFQQLAAKYPTVPGVHYLYGYYLSFSRPDEAIEEFRAELKANPSHVSANAMLAILLAHNKDYSAALPYAKKAATAAAQDASAQYAYGEALLGTGDLRAGIAHIEAAQHLDTEALEYHMALAGAYSRVGRYAEARRERQASIQMAQSDLLSATGNAQRTTELTGPAKAQNIIPQDH